MKHQMVRRLQKYLVNHGDAMVGKEHALREWSWRHDR